ncbi:MAG: hypothetical protein J6333_11320 [Planctomycetes bacterium]|nr:hypothetical protein [Planctomycetota bacterium]
MDVKALQKCLQTAPAAAGAQRVRHELDYAVALNAVRGNQWGALLDKAAAGLGAQLERDGCVTLAAAAQWEKEMSPLQAECKSLTVHCVGHAHIDMNWMWGHNETVAVVLDTFRTVMKLFDRYPQFTFSQSQASTYQIVERFDPELFAAIARRVKEGRWEVTASTWVEADKNLSDIESMARHLLYTRRYLQERFQLRADDVQIDYEPDTFGHSRFVPEILAQGGVKYYYHCRGNVPADGRDLHVWKSPSGKSVLMFREPDWYGGAIEFDMLGRVPAECRRNEVSHKLKVYGVGDHGGGPTRRDIERILAMGQWPLAPTVRFSTYRDFFKAVEKENPAFPVIDDELNYAFTGCYTSQAAIKGANRRSERALYAAEAADALAAALIAAPRYDFAEGWKNTLFNQFHDIVTGSGVVHTRNYAMGKYQETMGFAYGGRSRALNAIAGAIDTTVFGDLDDNAAYVDGAGCGYRGTSQWTSAFGGDADIRPVAAGGKKRIFVIFNPVARSRVVTVMLTLWDFDGDDNYRCVEDANGDRLPIELRDRNSWWMHNYRNVLTAVTLPATGYLTVVVGHGDVMVPQPRRTRDRIESYPDWTLENRHLRVVLNEKMEIVSCFDKARQQEMLEKPAGFFSLVYQNPHMDPGSGMAGNAWSESFPVCEQNLNETCPVFVTATAVGTLRPTYGYRIVVGQSEIRVEVSLDENSRMLVFDVGAEWRELYDDKKGIPALRFVWPVSAKFTRFVCRVPGGFVERHPEQHDVPAIGCAAVGGEGGGICLLSDATYGFRAHGGALSTSLLRNSQNPDNCPEVGFRDWKLAVAPTDMTAGDLSGLNDDFANGVFTVGTETHGGTLPPSGSLLALSAGFELAAVKRAEDGAGLVLRVVSLSKEKTVATVTFARALAGVALTDVLEQERQAVPFAGNAFACEFAGQETLTFKVDFQ